MILLLKEEDRDNDSKVTLQDAKMICDCRTIFGFPGRISNNQEFHLVSKELLEAAGRLELFCEHIHFHSYSH
jgi:hypothetical protein